MKLRIDYSTPDSESNYTDLETFLREKREGNSPFVVTFCGTGDGIELARFSDPAEVVKYVEKFRSIFLAPPKWWDREGKEVIGEFTEEVKDFQSNFILYIDGYSEAKENYDVFVLFGDKYWGEETVVGELTR